MIAREEARQAPRSVRGRFRRRRHLGVVTTGHWLAASLGASSGGKQGRQLVMHTAAAQGGLMCRACVHLPHGGQGSVGPHVGALFSHAHGGDHASLLWGAACTVQGGDVGAGEMWKRVVSAAAPAAINPGQKPQHTAWGWGRGWASVGCPVGEGGAVQGGADAVLTPSKGRILTSPHCRQAMAEAAARAGPPGILNS